MSLYAPEGTPLRTIPELRSAIRVARRVMVQIRFGSDEKWVKLSKREALDFLSGYTETATPRDVEMYDGSTFGEQVGSTVYMG